MIPSTIARGVSSRSSSTADGVGAVFVAASVTPDAISRQGIEMQVAPGRRILALAQILERTRIEDIARLDPTASRLIDAELKQFETLGRVRVARNHQLHAGVFGGDAIGIGKVEPLGLRIYLEGTSFAGGRAHHLVEIETA